jgi:hypothetical protein
MIFRVCEHYENSNQNNDDDDEDEDDDIILDRKECFICFEDEITNNFKIINLKDQVICIKSCLCNGLIHNECLKKWIDSHKSCPVCRKSVLEINQTIFIIHRYSPFCINIYLGVKTACIKFISFVTFICLLYVTFDYFVTILVVRSDLYEDFTFNSMNKLNHLPILINISDTNII